MYQHQIMSAQTQALNQAIRHFNIRVESVLGHTPNNEIHTNPISCYVCTGDATYEAGVAVSIGEVVGMSEWTNQWQSLVDDMRMVERKLRVCVVSPPEERRGPRFTTCNRCLCGEMDVEQNDGHLEPPTEDDNESPLRPFT